MNRLNYLLSGGKCEKEPEKTQFRFTAVVILFILVAIILVLAPYVKMDSNLKLGLNLAWIIPMGLYFLIGIIFVYLTTLFGKYRQHLSIFLIVLLVIQLIMGCVALAKEDPDLETREKGLLYGKLIILHMVLIMISTRDYFIFKAACAK